jgi:hypothetical protein
LPGVGPAEFGGSGVDGVVDDPEVLEEPPLALIPPDDGGAFGSPPGGAGAVRTGSAAHAASESETAISVRIRTGYARFNPESEMRT